MPSRKVTAVKAAPAKKAAAKKPAKENPARTMKVLKGWTVAHDLESAALITAITAAFDKHGKVAVTAQQDKALDRKMQQRVQSIGYRRGFNLNLATAITDKFVLACPRDPSKPKSSLQAPAKPRTPKAKTPPAKTAATPAKAVPVGKAERAGKGGKTTPAKSPAKKTTTRKATPRRTPAQAAYDHSFAKADQEKANLRAAKEAEAAKGGVVIVEDPTPEALAARGEEPHDIVVGGTTVLSVVTPDHDAQVKQGVLDVGAALLKLDPPLPAEAGLRIGMRGKEPVIETSYGQSLGRPFKGRAVAVDVLAEIDAIRKEAASDVA